MEIVKSVFEDRKKEINLYFTLIDFLDDIKRKDISDKHNELLTNKDLEKILRANSLLMLYNLIESTLINAIEFVYQTFRENNLTYGHVRQEIKEIWFNYRFSNAYDKNSHFYTYRKTALNIINSIMCGESLVLDRKATGISGNLDADSIRDVCKNHGIKFRTPSNCHGGIKLKTVKEQRNQLAHGTLSFVECGRDFTVIDLNEIKDEVILFMDGFIASIEQYYNNQDYLI